MPSLLSNLKSAREWATPTLKSSAFLSRGVLTPEEYVAAGDELVYKCPTWTWESGDPTKRKKHLPADKQFLMTRGVPCPARVRSMENVVNESVRGVGRRMMGGDGDGDGDDDDDDDDDDDGDDDDWLVSRILTEEECRKREEDALVEGFDVLDMDDDGGGGGGMAKSSTTAAGGGGGAAATATTTTTTSATKWGGNHRDDDDRHHDEYADMADFEDDDVMVDEAAAAAAVATPAPSSFISSGTNNKHDDGSNDNILRVRSYDVSITYDKYYQTPRVYLMGYADDGSNRPLTGDEMMEDVMSDYAHRTITVENHPHLAGPHASIHPCQHGAVMKTIVRNLTRDDARGNDGDGVGKDGGGGGDGGRGGGGGGPSVEMYLFIFLKFVSSMIPTISYDFTMDVHASTRK
jgi:ubiquitin-like-conjugating enzyme ATG3